MLQILLIGLAAGLASGLLFASILAGSFVSFLLFYLAPLPIIIAGLGWSHFAALLAALVAAAGLAAAFGGLLSVAFLVGLGLPAWWLSYLALLARPAPANPDGMQWYPVGRLVLWAGFLAAIAIVIAIPVFGTDAQSFDAALRGAFEQLLRSATDTPAHAPLVIPGISDPERLLDWFVTATPPFAAAGCVLTSLANLWLAGRIVKLSGRLRRPWPDLASIALPRYAPALLGAALVAMFAGDLLGIVAGILAASLMVAFALVGLAVVHTATRGMNGRSFVLSGIYASVAVFGWPALLLSVVGLADLVVDFRRRAKGHRLPDAST